MNGRILQHDSGDDALSGVAAAVVSVHVLGHATVIVTRR